MGIKSIKKLRACKFSEFLVTFSLKHSAFQSLPDTSEIKLTKLRFYG
jgi:hypothetical protein